MTTINDFEFVPYMTSHTTPYTRDRAVVIGNSGNVYIGGQVLRDLGDPDFIRLHTDHKRNAILVEVVSKSTAGSRKVTSRNINKAGEVTRGAISARNLGLPVGVYRESGPNIFVLEQ